MTDCDLTINARNFSYRVLIKNNIIDSLGKNVRLLFPSDRTLVVSDHTVFSLYGEVIMQSLADQYWNISTYLIKPGERSKTYNSAGRVFDAAVQAGLDRNSPVIALGGGVVGDLAGFVAATFMRGVPLVVVPTTLLAQVDSSIGGKVAVNHPRGKNLIGSIYPPRLVVTDPSTLQTLPFRQLTAGMVEVIKCGIVEDSNLFCWLENNIDQLLQRDQQATIEAVIKAVSSKARIVEADEFEKNFRRVLNFGHTIGHALEAATGYRYYLHGEAVLAGMIVATEMAYELGVLDKDSQNRIESLLRKLVPKKAPKSLTASMVIDKLVHDKKRCNQDIIFVFPAAIGETEIVPVRNKKLIARMVEAYLQR